MVSKCRQNYHEDAEAAINKQVVTIFVLPHFPSMSGLERYLM